MSVLVTTRNLSMAHPGRRRLKLPDMTIQTGDRVLLRGPSGSGKTTFLRLIADLESPNHGALSVTARKITYAFQEPRLIPNISATENLVAATGISASKAAYVLDKVGLSDIRNEPCATLSGGEAQRVNLCRAMLGEPDLILIDEAATGLDAENRSRITRMFAEFNCGKALAVLEIAHSPNPPLMITTPTQTIDMIIPDSLPNTG